MVEKLASRCVIRKNLKPVGRSLIKPALDLASPHHQSLTWPALQLPSDMAPTILIVGATGNTGKNAVKTLSKLLESSKTFSDHRILALTRTANSPAAQSLTSSPGVEVLEKNWPLIDAAWLQENEVVRAFIVSHNGPSQFSEESGFLVAALKAGVKYVVRISTTEPNVRPDCPTFYARTHWAIETLLSQPEFQGLQWTSLQPNSFTPLYLYAATEFIKAYRKTGKQEKLRMAASADVPSAPIHPDEVGAIAAHLLATDDVSPHNHAKYVINGPEDITGEQIIKLVEDEIGTKVEDVSYKDLTVIVDWAAASGEMGHLILTLKHSLEVSWEGKTTAATTSKEILEIAAPKQTPVEVFKSIVGALEKK